MDNELAALFPRPSRVSLPHGGVVEVPPLRLAQLPQVLDAAQAVLIALEEHVGVGTIPREPEAIATLIVESPTALSILHAEIRQLFGIDVPIDAIPRVLEAVYTTNRLDHIFGKGASKDRGDDGEGGWMRCAEMLAREYGWTPNELGSMYVSQFVGFSEVWQERGREADAATSATTKRSGTPMRQPDGPPRIVPLTEHPSMGIKPMPEGSGRKLPPSKLVPPSKRK